MRRQDFIELRKRFSGKTITELIDLLGSEDLCTRFLAEMCLRDATAT